MMEEGKYYFSDIQIGGEFTIHKLSTILVKLSETHYCIKGQTRLWRANKNKYYYKNEN